MYNYRPVNSDELELREGDLIYVLEQCDDGWYDSFEDSTQLILILSAWNLHLLNVH